MHLAKTSTTPWKPPPPNCSIGHPPGPLAQSTRIPGAEHSAHWCRATKTHTMWRGRRGIYLLERKRALRANHRAHESPFYAPLGHIGPRGGLNLSSPSTSAKVNRLVIRYLHFWSVRGDLQEGHGYGKRLHDYASRWQFLSSQCQFLPSRSPLTSSRAQNWGFCALFAFGTPIIGLFKHKNRLFVLFYPPEPPILGFSSTKSRFLCAFWLRTTRFRTFRAQNWGFCAREAGKEALGNLKISIYT